MDPIEANQILRSQEFWTTVRRALNVPYGWHRAAALTAALEASATLRPFRLLDLPAEVRTRIYNYILKDGIATHQLRSLALPNILRTPQHRSDLYASMYSTGRLKRVTDIDRETKAMIMTCHTVRHEMVPLWYDSVRIEVTIPDMACPKARKLYQDWLEWMDWKGEISMIRHLKFRTERKRDHDWMLVNFTPTFSCEWHLQEPADTLMSSLLYSGHLQEFVDAREVFRQQCLEVRHWLEGALGPKLERGEGLLIGDLRRLSSPFMAVKLRYAPRIASSISKILADDRQTGSPASLQNAEVGGAAVLSPRASSLIIADGAHSARPMRQEHDLQPKRSHEQGDGLQQDKEQKPAKTLRKEGKLRALLSSLKRKCRRGGRG